VRRRAFVPILLLALTACIARRAAVKLPPEPRVATSMPVPGAVSRTYSPREDQPSYTVWNVVACGQQDVPAGQIYQELAAHGIGFLINTQANDLLATVETQSFWAQAFAYGSYAAAGLAALMNLDVVKAKPSLVKTGNVAAGVLNTLLPLAQKKAPAGMPAWYQLLVRDHDVVRVGANDCETAVALGGRGTGFTVSDPQRGAGAASQSLIDIDK